MGKIAVVGITRGCVWDWRSMPEAVGVSDVVRRIGPELSTAGGLPGVDVGDFAFDFPMPKKPRKPPLLGLAFFEGSEGFGESENGLGFAWAGGRK